jgi:copper chaperone CopZ
VNWKRDYSEAINLSKLEKKPIFILFQEVPGCSTCKNFGNEIVSHPLVVEAIETYFIPLAVFNNKGGADAEILKKFKEPSWNNPICRVLDADGKDLVERGDGLYTLKSFVPFLNKAIFKTNRFIPHYLSLLEEELIANKKELVLQMYCFWTGEKELGGLYGVIKTEPGFHNGAEVVKVTYDHNKTTKERLITAAKEKNVADKIHNDYSHYKGDKDIHYYLKNSKYNVVPMTALQATKINSLIGKGESIEQLLSPRQKNILNNTQKKERYNNSIYSYADLFKGN